MIADAPVDVVLAAPHSASARHPVSIDQIAAVADGRARLVVSPDVFERLDRVRDAAIAVARQRPVYGRSTGVGANKSVLLGDRSGYASALLHSHATSGGPLRAARRVRAMLCVRCMQLCAGGSGVAPAVLQAAVALLDSDVLPPVGEYGSIGTGDLSALATTALTLLGELGASDRHVDFDRNDALAFISSNAATIGDAALAGADLATLARASLSVAALTFTAVDGNLEAFSALVEQVTPFPGAQEVCRAMRQLLDGSRPAARIQDPFGLRAFPQVHGVLLESLRTLADLVSSLATTAAENPVFSADPPAVAHHGGFHMAYLATALDTLRSTLAQSAQLNQTRLAYLVDPALTGLTPFLGDGALAASGVMVVEYVVASALAELRAAAVPAAVHSVSISRGVEDDASFAALAAVQALRVTDTYRTILASELVAAVRAIRMRSLTVDGPIAELMNICAPLPAEVADRDLTDDLEVAAGLLPALARN